MLAFKEQQPSDYDKINEVPDSYSYLNEEINNIRDPYFKALTIIHLLKSKKKENLKDLLLSAIENLKDPIKKIEILIKLSDLEKKLKLSFDCLNLAMDEVNNINDRYYQNENLKFIGIKMAKLGKIKAVKKILDNPEVDTESILKNIVIFFLKTNNINEAEKYFIKITDETEKAFALIEFAKYFKKKNKNYEKKINEAENLALLQKKEITKFYIFKKIVIFYTEINDLENAEKIISLMENADLKDALKIEIKKRNNTYAIDEFKKRTSKDRPIYNNFKEKPDVKMDEALLTALLGNFKEAEEIINSIQNKYIKIKALLKLTLFLVNKEVKMASYLKYLNQAFNLIKNLEGIEKDEALKDFIITKAKIEKIINK